MSDRKAVYSYDLTIDPIRIWQGNDEKLLSMIYAEPNQFTSHESDMTHVNKKIKFGQEVYTKSSSIELTSKIVGENEALRTSISEGENVNNIVAVARPDANFGIQNGDYYATEVDRAVRCFVDDCKSVAPEFDNSNNKPNEFCEILNSNHQDYIRTNEVINDDLKTSVEASEDEDEFEKNLSQGAYNDILTDKCITDERAQNLRNQLLEREFEKQRSVDRDDNRDRGGEYEEKAPEGVTSNRASQVDWYERGKGYDEAMGGGERPSSSNESRPSQPLSSGFYPQPKGDDFDRKILTILNGGETAVSSREGAVDDERFAYDVQNPRPRKTPKQRNTASRNPRPRLSEADRIRRRREAYNRCMDKKKNNKENSQRDNELMEKENQKIREIIEKMAQAIKLMKNHISSKP